MACQKIAQGREDIKIYKAVSIHKNVGMGLVYLHSLLYSLFLVCVIFWHAIPTSLLIFLVYSGNGHPSTADTHDITGNSESPNCPSIHFSTPE